MFVFATTKLRFLNLLMKSLTLFYDDHLEQSIHMVEFQVELASDILFVV